MRLLPLTLLTIALATAGCFGGDDGEDGSTTPTPTTGTPASPTPTTGATPTPPTEEGNTTTPPAAKAPKEVFTDTANFEQAPSDPQNPVQTKAFTVEEGYKKLTLNVTWHAATPVIVQQGVSIDIASADGTVIAACAGPANGPAPAEIPVCSIEGAIMAGGEYQANYHGGGTLTATVSVVAS